MYRRWADIPSRRDCSARMAMISFLSLRYRRDFFG